MGLNILALAESVNHVCCRYRIRAFQPLWEAAGHRLTVVALGDSLRQHWRALGEAGDFDAVILQRKLLSRWEVQRLRKRARRLIFDFDDAVWLRDSYSAKGFDSPKRSRRFRRIVEACDWIVTGNRYLGEYAGKFIDTANIVAIPTCVDSAKYSLAKHDRPAGNVKLAWLGSSSTLQGIELQRELFDRVAEALPQATFKVICDRFPEFAKMPVETVPWNEATEAAALADADIGIGWVPDDPWSRGKCGLKLLQYQAAGLAVIANPVGVQSEIVRTGETGMLANTAEEWLREIVDLAYHPEHRRRLGASGRANVEAKFSVALGASAWLELFARL